MLGLNGIIIDWSLPSKLKSIWINQLLNRKSLSSGQEANLRPCTLAGLYFALFLQTCWEIFSFLFFLLHTQKKTAFTETGSGSQVLRSPCLALPAENTCQALQHPDGAAQEFWLLLRASCWQLGQPHPWQVQSGMRYSMEEGAALNQQRCGWLHLAGQAKIADTQRSSPAVRRGW